MAEEKDPAAPPATPVTKPFVQTPPTPCRLVMYNLEKADTISHHLGVDGKLQITQSPAMVLFVNPDGTLRLSVYQQFGGAAKVVPMAKEGTVPGTWMWPVRA
jgi:hypothetical protein